MDLAHEDIVWPLAIVAALVLGFVWFYLGANCIRDDQVVCFGMWLMILLISLILHVVAVFSPWMATADCEQGQPWLLHFLYASANVISVPLLSGMTDRRKVNTVDQEFRIPIPCLGGGTACWLKLLYIYAATSAAGADAYLDNNTIVIAKNCEYDHWPKMLALLIASMLLQAMAGAATGAISYTNNGNGDLLCRALFFFILTLAGANTDALALSNKGTDEEHGMQMVSGVVAATRFFSESLPQAYFAIDFAVSKGHTGLVLVQVIASVSFSTLLAAKSAATALRTLGVWRAARRAAGRVMDSATIGKSATAGNSVVPVLP